jgi:hydroxymethylpyrimidine/phosphomethylpyrimidine kinase
MGCPSRARVLASGTFASPIRVNAQYTRLARTSRSIGCDTVKTGMLANAEIIDAVAAAISDHRLGPRAERINTKNTHGSGCIFASAIAAKF